MAKNEPIQKISIWPVSAAVWQNGEFHNVTFEKSYKDDQDKYQSSDSFGRDDLLKLAKLADQAHTFILRAEAKAREAAQQ